MIDSNGRRPLSRRALNDETVLRELNGDVLALSDEVPWAIDLRTLPTDLIADRTRQINRLRAQLLEIFPTLERALELTNPGSVALLTGCTREVVRRDR